MERVLGEGDVRDMKKRLLFSSLFFCLNVEPSKSNGSLWRGYLLPIMAVNWKCD